MAHKKAGGSSKNGRDSNAQRRGVKRYDGQLVSGGHILVRQCGTKFHAGDNVGCGKDYTLYSLIEGSVKFTKKGPRHARRTYVHVIDKKADQVEAA